MGDFQPKWPVESSSKLEIPNISKIVEVSHCQSVLLTSEVKTNLVCFMIKITIPMT